MTFGKALIDKIKAVFSKIKISLNREGIDIRWIDMHGKIHEAIDPKPFQLEGRLIEDEHGLRKVHKRGGSFHVSLPPSWVPSITMKEYTRLALILSGNPSSEEKHILLSCPKQEELEETPKL